MSIHNDRADMREKQENPINFTCGVCHRVVPFQEGYICGPCEEAKKKDEEV